MHLFQQFRNMILRWNSNVHSILKFGGKLLLLLLLLFSFGCRVKQLRSFDNFISNLELRISYTNVPPL